MTFSPARAHKAKITAEAAAKQVSDNVEAGSEYDVMLANLDQQRRSLKSVQSREAKQALKTEYLAEWADYIATTLAEDSGAHDPIISRLWIWLLDTGNVVDAIHVGRYLLDHELPTPEGFNRTTATAFAEEIAEMWLGANDKGSINLDADALFEVVDMTEMHDMPDEVRAKLHRALGEALADSDIEQAQAHLSRAVELNPRVGCKKQLTALTKKLNAED